MVKVLFVIPELSYGGTNTVLKGILPFLSDYSISCQILSLKHGNNIFSNSCVFQLNKLEEFLVSSPFCQKLYNVLSRKLNINCIKGFIWSHIASRVESRIKSNLVVAFQEGVATEFCSYFEQKKFAWVHCDYNLYKELHAPIVKYEEECYRKYSKIVCVSRYTSLSFKENFPMLSQYVDYVYNPMDRERIEDMSLAASDVVFTNTFNIISVGRFVKVKQFHLIPNIVKRIVDKGVTEFRWYIVGDGDDILISETKNKILEYGISDYLILLGSKQNPYPYIKKSSLLVSTSYSEAYPCVVNEAKLLRVPVLVNNYPTASEVVNEKMGRIVPLESMADEIIEMIKKPFNYVEMKDSCDSYVYDNIGDITKIVEILR